MKYIFYAAIIWVLIRQQQQINHETWRVEKLIDAIAAQQLPGPPPTAIPNCAWPAPLPTSPDSAGQVPLERDN